MPILMLPLIVSSALYCVESTDPQLMPLKKDLPTTNMTMQARLEWFGSPMRSKSTPFRSRSLYERGLDGSSR